MLTCFSLCIRSEEVMAHRAVVAAASPALDAAIQREQQRQPGAPLLWIELGSHVQAGDLRLLVQYAYSGVLSVAPAALDTAQPAAAPTASGRTAKRLALLAHALQMKQAAALLQVPQGSGICCHVTQPVIWAGCFVRCAR